MKRIQPHIFPCNYAGIVALLRNFQMRHVPFENRKGTISILYQGLDMFRTAAVVEKILALRSPAYFRYMRMAGDNSMRRRILIDIFGNVLADTPNPVDSFFESLFSFRGKRDMRAFGHVLKPVVDIMHDFKSEIAKRTAFS